MGISPPIQAANLGMADSLILMVLALVVFGPRRLPQIGRQIGKLMFEFRKASNDFKFQMEEELRNSEEADRRKREEAERQKALTDAQSAAATAQSAAEQALNAAEEIKAAQAATAEYVAASQPPATELPPAVEEQPAETGLRVQPPSTGEQVASARAGSVAATPEPAESSEPVPAPPTSTDPELQERLAMESSTKHG